MRCRASPALGRLRQFPKSALPRGFRVGVEEHTCGPGDIIVSPGGVEHEGWIEEDTEVIDVFSPPREDFLAGGKPVYMTEA